MLSVQKIHNWNYSRVGWFNFYKNMNNQLNLRCLYINQLRLLIIYYGWKDLPPIVPLAHKRNLPQFIIFV